jgi:flagellar hook-associated protein 3 FlgL
MRISNQALTNELVANLNQNRNELVRINRQVSTGRTVNQPSDAPGAYATSREMEARIDRNTLFQNNIQTGMEEARVAADTIDQMVDQLRELKRLATQGANNTLDAESMNILANRTNGLRDAIVQLANKSYNGRYLFSGTATLSQPFSISGSSVNYAGNNETLTVGISDNVTVATSVNGNELFTFDTTDSVFQVIARVVSALQANDANAVRAELDAIDKAIEQVSGRGSDLGNNINRMEFAYYDYETSTLSLTTHASRLVDTDYAAALSRLQNLDTSYQAALSAGSRLMRLSLVNYL